MKATLRQKKAAQKVMWFKLISGENKLTPRANSNNYLIEIPNQLTTKVRLHFGLVFGGISLLISSKK